MLSRTVLSSMSGREVNGPAALRWMLRRRPSHYALGESFDSPCGIYSLWNRGLSYTRKQEDVTCGHCRRWLAKQSVVTTQPKVVSE